MADIIFEEFSFLSADGHTTTHAYLWRPANVQPRAIIQLSHGMCEYIERYDTWARRFAEAGFIFCGNDHLGHGHTAPDEEELGYMDGDGALLLVEDLHTMSVQMKTRFPGMPLLLYGHSMGSFAARYYLSLYGQELDGALISGTGGPEQPTGLGLAVVSAIRRVKGAHHRSKLITALAFGAYNKKFKEENDPHAWLTRDKEIRGKYLNDPLCHFIFTTTGYRTLFTLLRTVSDKKWAQTVPKTLPILLFSGDMDPVGNYGKGVRVIADRMTRAGCNVTLKLYEGARHEMHHEINRDEVFDDLLHFINDTLTEDKNEH